MDFIVHYLQFPPLVIAGIIAVTRQRSVKVYKHEK